MSKIDTAASARWKTDSGLALDPSQSQSRGMADQRRVEKGTMKDDDWTEVMN